MAISVVPLWVRDDGSARARALLAEGALGLAPDGVETLDLTGLRARDATLLDGSGDVPPSQGLNDPARATSARLLPVT